MLRWLQWYCVFRFLTFKGIGIIVCFSLACGILASWIIPQSEPRDPNAIRWFGPQVGYETQVESKPHPVIQKQETHTESPNNHVEVFEMSQEEYMKLHNSNGVN